MKLLHERIAPRTNCSTNKLLHEQMAPRTKRKQANIHVKVVESSTNGVSPHSAHSRCSQFEHSQSNNKSRVVLPKTKTQRQLIGIPLTLGVICYTTSDIIDLIRTKASVAWPTSPGRVLSSSVVQKGMASFAEVVYEFNVNNTTYSGKRIASGDKLFPAACSSLIRAQEIVNRYPQDKNVTVHYMPSNPKKCLLEVGVKGHAFVAPVCCLLVFIIVLGFVTGELLELW